MERGSKRRSGATCSTLPCHGDKLPPSCFRKQDFCFFLRYSRCLTAVRQLHHNCGATNTCLAKTKAGGQKTIVGGREKKNDHTRRSKRLSKGERCKPPLHRWRRDHPHTEKKQPTDWRLTASMLCPKEEISKVIYLSTHLATRILTSYSKYNGMVTKTRVIKSGGVITAATSIIMRNECFR